MKYLVIRINDPSQKRFSASMHEHFEEAFDVWLDKSNKEPGWVLVERVVWSESSFWKKVIGLMKWIKGNDS